MSSGTEGPTGSTGGDNLAAWDSLARTIEAARAQVALFYADFLRDPIGFNIEGKLLPWMRAVVKCDRVTLLYDFARDFIRELSDGTTSRSEAEDKRIGDEFWAYMYSGQTIRRECRRLHGLDVPSDPNHDRAGYEGMRRRPDDPTILAYSDCLRYRRMKYMQAIAAIQEQEGREQVLLGEAATATITEEMRVGSGERPGSLASAEEESTTAFEGCIFRRSGDVWFLRFAGMEKSLSHRKGLECLRRLLARPNEGIHVSELDTDGPIAKATDRSHQPIADQQALAKYQERITELEERLSKAIDDNDLATQEAVENEKARLVGEIRSSSGLGGKSRSFSDDEEKCRSRVANAIKKALETIKSVHGPLFTHLDKSLLLRSGRSPQYVPPHPQSWVTV